MSNCLIIGGNSGIGKAVANKLSGRQDLFLVYCPVHTEMDVTSAEHVERYIRTNGPFDQIVYSAGVNRLQWIGPGIMSQIGHTMHVNVGGFVSVISAHKSEYPDRPVSVVAVSSDAAERPMRGSLAYCASKAALDMAIKVAARELAPLWRVNGVAPGMVEGTPMTDYIDRTIPLFRGWTPEEAREYERTSVPTGRRATLEEVADTIIWVLTGPAQMTGEIVKINGGRT